MPRFVDHESRRELVTATAADLIASGGVDALTVRGVAAAAGFSTAVVSHYFEDKRDLVRSTYLAAANRATERFENTVRADGRTLASCLEALLPLDEESRRDWQLFVSFWGTAASDAELAAMQRKRVRSARVRVYNVLRDDFGPAAEDAELRAAARTLLTIVQGISTQAVFDPRDWSARRQVTELAYGLELTLAHVRTAPAR